MIHIDNKFVVPGDSITDLVTSVYGDINENYADRYYVIKKLFFVLKMVQLIYVIHQLPAAVFTKKLSTYLVLKY